MSLALALRSAGAHLTGFTTRTAEGRARAEAYLGKSAVSHIGGLVAGSPHLYFLTVPDDALPKVAGELAFELRRQLAPPSPFVAHTSGATSVKALAPCEAAGAHILAFHPLQTFGDPTIGSARFAGAALAITPSTTAMHSTATALGFALAEELHARPFLLPDDRRSLYHAAATFASNYLITLEHHAERLFVLAGLPQQEALGLFLPLVRATVDNIADQGTTAALTGPLSRGDSSTVAAHLQALTAAAPHILPLYRSLGLATLDVMRAGGGADPGTTAELTGVLRGPDLPAALESRTPGI